MNLRKIQLISTTMKKTAKKKKIMENAATLTVSSTKKKTHLHVCDVTKDLLLSSLCRSSSGVTTVGWTINHSWALPRFYWMIWTCPIW